MNELAKVFVTLDPREKRDIISFITEIFPFLYRSEYKLTCVRSTNDNNELNWKPMAPFSRCSHQHRVQGLGEEHPVRPVREAWLGALRADGGPHLSGAAGSSGGPPPTASRRFILNTVTKHSQVRGAKRVWQPTQSLAGRLATPGGPPLPIRPSRVRRPPARLPIAPSDSHIEGGLFVFVLE